MAASPDGREAITKEMDETRERLALTIDQLIHRTSPKTIASRQVAAVRGTFIDPASGRTRTDNIAKLVGGIVVVVVILGVVRKVVGKD